MSYELIVATCRHDQGFDDPGTGATIKQSLLYVKVKPTNPLDFKESEFQINKMLDGESRWIFTEKQG